MTEYVFVVVCQIDNKNLRHLEKCEYGEGKKDDDPKHIRDELQRKTTQQRPTLGDNRKHQNQPDIVGYILYNHFMAVFVPLRRSRSLPSRMVDLSSECVLHFNLSQ